MKRVLILNGPNLNMLGIREPEIYGRETLADLKALCEKSAKELDIAIDFRQSNHEGVLIDWIHEARGNFDAIIINAGGLTHTSISILDAFKAVALPVVEVHISDLKKRESFRHFSYIAQAAELSIAGEGLQGYVKALAHLAKA